MEAPGIKHLHLGPRGYAVHWKEQLLRLVLVDKLTADEVVEQVRYGSKRSLRRKHRPLHYGSLVHKLHVLQVTLALVSMLVLPARVFASSHLLHGSGRRRHFPHTPVL